MEIQIYISLADIIERRNHLFASVAPNHPGTGLGLSVAHHIKEHLIGRKSSAEVHRHVTN